MSCRQVDAFFFCGSDDAALRAQVFMLGTKIKIESESGLVNHYNGLGVIQSHEYIKIHVDNCIDNILDGRGWAQGTPPSSKHIEPIHPSSFKELESVAVSGDPHEAHKLEDGHLTVVMYPACSIHTGVSTAVHKTGEHVPPVRQSLRYYSLPTFCFHASQSVC
jgi:hypothetical protein